MPLLSTLSKHWYIKAAGAAAVLVFLICFFLLRAPFDFPTGSIIIIPQGLTVDAAAQLLKADHVILSPSVFSVLVNLFSKEKVIAGGYKFERSLSVFSVALRVSSGDFRAPVSKVTFPEGTNIKEMALICEKFSPGCVQADFITAAQNKEGYLFPDTYFILPGTKASDVVARMEQSFQTKLAPIASDIAHFGKAPSDVITMASILEEEAQSDQDRRIVAGILWRRISLAMTLQVDSTLKYINGKTSDELTASDLASNSPYNTYRFKGLPPTPISNPGLEAIEAAVTPISTPYLFYLSDKDGVFHYARTYAEHLKNKQKYLK